MQADLAVLVGLGVREAGSEAEGLAASFIEETLRGVGAAVDIRQVPLPDREGSINVLATFGEGTVHVLLGAHFDSKPPSPGADDNGSGVVVLLEMARRLAEASPEGQQITLAFLGAEEFLVGVDGNAHHFGSRLLAEQLADTGNLPDLMVSVDMVGVGENLLAVTYLDSDTTAAELIAEAAERQGMTVSVESRGDISDHEAFARQGVSSVFLWRPDNPDYHLAGDLEVRTSALLEDLSILETFLELAGR
jgi:Zn-dependent M28 family amino/carboxypeptidase